VPFRGTFVGDTTRSERSTDMTSTMNRNGVDVAALFATIDAVKGDPDLAKFQFRAGNTWTARRRRSSTSCTGSPRA
jgi:hypothetical protein